MDGSALSEELAERLSQFKKIKQVSMLGSISSKTTRDKIRNDFKDKEAVILLTENDKQFEEVSESE